MKYFDKEKNCLVFIEKKSTPEMWDSHWNKVDLEQAAKAVSDRSFVRRFSKKYLAVGSKVIEGGCGKGQYVKALKRWGFIAYGVDYAAETVAQIINIFPDLNISTSDVRSLPFADNFFDGYWSLGVIEHFYEGFDLIASEMRRVIKDGGYLFVTFPYMSPLRRLKAWLGLYDMTIGNNHNQLENFYQFALDKKKVVTVFEELGFVLQEAYQFDGVKGMKDEIKILKGLLRYIYDSNVFVIKVLKKIIDLLTRKWSGHSILFILRLNKPSA